MSRTAASFFPVLPLLLAADTSPPTPPEPPPPVVAVYGDSYSVGYDGVGEYDRNWSQIMGRQLGVDVVNMATGGAGYIATAYGTSFPNEVVTRPVPEASAVVVFGGLNDLTVDPEWVRVAAVTTFAAARTSSPDAELLVIGPQWPTATVDPRMWRLRDAVAAAAGLCGATFVDPLAEGWFASRPGLLMWDGKHPSPLGHQLLADRIGPHVTAALAVPA